MAFSRQEYWNGLSFPSPGGLPDLGTEPASPALAGGFFTICHQGSPVYKELYTRAVLLLRVGLNVCVSVSLGLLELAKLPPSGQKKQEFILPQLWRPEVQNQGVSRLWRLWRSVLLCRFQPLVVVSFP